MSSRQMKRVPMDFAWPLHKTWYGFLNPYRLHDCPLCGGSGENEAMRKISQEFFSFDNRTLRWCSSITQDEVQVLLDKGRLNDWTRKGITPTAEMVNEATVKGNWMHDAINRSYLIETRAKRLGVYGYCKLCNGKGYIADPGVEKLHEKWKQKEPPKGEGFQLWESVSEGSPISPVFKTLDELAEWASTNATTFADFKATKEEWKRMLSDDFVFHKEGNVVFL